MFSPLMYEQCSSEELLTYQLVEFGGGLLNSMLLSAQDIFEYRSVYLGFQLRAEGELNRLQEQKQELSTESKQYNKCTRILFRSPLLSRLSLNSHLERV